MATNHRRSTPGLIDQARAEPWRFGFFQLVRLLRLHYSRTGRIDPENRPNQDPLRFRSLLSLNFPPSEISDLDFEDETLVSPDGDPLTEIEVAFMGLVGPSGVLPRPYTETLIDRHIEKRDDAAHAFMDLFSHRMTALFYEAWQKYRFHIEYERKGTADFTNHLLHLTGFTKSTAEQQLDQLDDPSSLPRDLFSWFSGAWAQQPRNAGNLESILSYYFSECCEIEPFAGRWIRLEPDQCTRLGQINSRLGESAVAGTRIRDYQSCFRIRFGPMNLEAYCALLPGTPKHQQLVKLVRLYVGIELDFEIELIVDRDVIPNAQLNGQLSLGRTLWLKSPTRDAIQHGRTLFTIDYDGATA